jgi:hypothetical protein
MTIIVSNNQWNEVQELLSTLFGVFFKKIQAKTLGSCVEVSGPYAEMCVLQQNLS